ncbi:MFS transporter [Saccharothrix violaceirubra]|uniref:DHA1 family chloramphenicol resistance protein-like MFS transporter n=2 Tax=Saccharothrix violaceirubra TaxID=413306 RepID=A0A7W7T690_9PSEU|nr:DHA1 family chloramphenicol resistance protein-like MFS transporter [Saccharothrix violaceirubra]
MGTSEFMLAGFLPDLAGDLHVTVGTAGTLTTAFAVGMVVGAPLVAVLARRWSGRVLPGFVLVFLATHVVGATTSSFAVLFATRVVAALAYAGFLAVALTTATGLVPPDRTGRALAVLLSGTTLATVVGVPGGAVLGALSGWRSAFWVVTLLCVPAAVGVLTGRPARTAPAARPALRSEFALLGRPRLALAMLLGALVNAATFGGFTFLAPVVTDTAGLDGLWVPVVLMLFGVGSFFGVTAAGRLSERHRDRVLAVGGPLLSLGWAALALLADESVALMILVPVQGALSFAVGGVLITRVVHEASGAPTLAGAYATAALNVGAAVGPLVAAGTSGTRGPLWASVALVALASLIAFAARNVLTAREAHDAGSGERRRTRRR